MVARGSAALANAANNTACAKGLFELLRVDLAESWAAFCKSPCSSIRIIGANSGA